MTTTTRDDDNDNDNVRLFCLLCYLCFGCFMQLPCTQELRRGVIIVFVISSGIIVQFQAKVIIDKVGH